MKREIPAFSGWCVVYNEKCSNGDIFMPRSMESNDQRFVPLLLNHDPRAVLGYAQLRAREQGVFCDCYLHEPSAFGQLVHDLVREQRLHWFSIGLCRNVFDTGRKESSIISGFITEVSLCINENAKNHECVITRVSPRS